MARFVVRAGDLDITVDMVRMGADLSVSLYGGTLPHVGCAVLAIPRPSLTGQGLSATVSTLNCLGHKDDELASFVARQVATRLNVTVSCTAGVHVDDATPQTIEAVLESASGIVDRIVSAYQA